MKTLLSRAALAAAAMALGLSGAAANGLTANGTLTVKLQINGSCTVASPTINFPPQTSSSSEQVIQIPANIAVTCTPSTTSYTLSFSGGSNYSNGSRYMVSQSDSSKQVQYALYKDSGYSNLLDAGGFVSGSGTSVLFYLQATVSSGLSTGLYTDAIALTLNY